jgi:hypothetical protein
VALVLTVLCSPTLTRACSPGSPHVFPCRMNLISKSKTSYSRRNILTYTRCPFSVLSPGNTISDEQLDLGSARRYYLCVNPDFFAKLALLSTGNSRLSCSRPLVLFKTHLIPIATCSSSDACENHVYTRSERVPNGNGPPGPRLDTTTPVLG